MYIEFINFLCYYLIVLSISAKKVQIIFAVLISIIITFGISFYLSYNYDAGFLPIGLKYKEAPTLEQTNYPIIEGYLANYFAKYASLSSKAISTVDTWNPKEELFQAEVLSVDVPNNILNIRMSPPASNIYSQSFDVKVTCKLDESIILDKMLSPVQYGSIVVKEIKSSYTLYSFCMNDDCTEIGKACLFGPAE